MRNKIINVVVVILVIIALPMVYLLGYNDFKKTNTVKNDNELKGSSHYLKEDKITDIVFNHANVEKDKVKDFSIELDIEHNRVIYDIDFEFGDYDYEYEVNALTGEIISDYKELDKVITTTKKTTTKKTTTKKTTTYKINKSKAKEIALKDAKVNENDIRDYDIELDYERGKYIYEIDFESGKTEYSYDIDADTGKIIKKEKELDN